MKGLFSETLWRRLLFLTTAKVPIRRKRSKHINTMYHFVRELAETSLICIKYLESSVKPTDVLTKGVGRPKHLFCMEHLRLSGCVDLKR